MLNDLLNSNSFIVLSIIMFMLLIINILILLLFQRRKTSKYDEEHKRVELDLLRRKLEDQIYNINETFSNKKEKWKDLNYLQLGANEFVESKNKKIQLNSFLKSAGLQESDLNEDDFVFVLTPFHEKYDNVYRIIKNVCDKADIRCIRGDEQNIKSDIFTHVLSNIVRAKVIVANLSGRNPNVLYELGLAHALDKTTIMISKLLDELPVDIKSKRIVTYKNLNDLESTLPIELLKIYK